MSLIKCMDCNKKISDKADVCMHCGCPVELTLKEITERDKEINSENQETKKVKKSFVYELKEMSNKKRFLLAGGFVVFIFCLFLLYNVVYSKVVFNKTDNEIISDIFVEYKASENKCVKFYFPENKYNKISKSKGDITLKITNDLGTVVYSGTKPINNSCYTKNSSYDKSLSMGTIYILDSEITPDICVDGTVNIGIKIGDFINESYKANISNLPVKDAELKMPDFPYEYTDYTYSGTEVKTKTRINNITCSSKTYSYSNETTIELGIDSTMIYNSESPSEKSVSIDYKVRNEEGTIIKSSSIYINACDTGDNVISKETISGLKPGGKYTFEITDIEPVVSDNSDS